ncbi:hypothetical protein BC739_009363 [Kutzneria viridogrisea]|uniref:Uncharacterized protein n=1 Tax=Kutzneria viridogrisea TaxID=47990 RepID=A0ABR6BYW3_9PSEU|nr:hypothetical protein [Kutzneria viridogrisea]
MLDDDARTRRARSLLLVVCGTVIVLIMGVLAMVLLPLAFIGVGGSVAGGGGSALLGLAALRRRRGRQGKTGGRGLPRPGRRAGDASCRPGSAH